MLALVTWIPDSFYDTSAGSPTALKSYTRNENIRKRSLKYDNFYNKTCNTNLFITPLGLNFKRVRSDILSP